MKRRVLSLLLALVLVLSLTPAALAYDGHTQVQGELAAVHEEPLSSVAQVPVHDELAAAYEGQGVSIAPASAPAQRSTALFEIDPDVTGWTEEIPWSAPVSGLGTESTYGAAVSEAQVYQTINALRKTYPEGMYWTNESQEYTLSVPGYNEKDSRYYTMIGYGCVAFCYRLSDAAFNTTLARKIYNFTYDDIRVGDILRVNNDQHSVTVLQKYSDRVVLAEANYGSAVHWDRTMTRAEVMKSDYIMTRYPANLTSLKVVVDKTTVQPGEQVTVSVKSPLLTAYDIEVWKGARGTGTLDWSTTGVDRSNSYWFKRYDTGIYTLYITSRNDDNRVISGTATFTVSDGKPSNVKVSTDKSSYAPGETIKISYSAADADSYNISVWRGAYSTGTKVTSSSGLSSSGATWKTTTPGTYTVYLEAVNSKGVNSATCQFTVTGGKPSNVKVSTDKSSYAPDETIKISYSAADADSYNISVWRGAYGTGTKVTSTSGLSSSGATWKTSTPGTYTLYLEAVNSYGAVSATCQFTVTGGKPSNVKVSTDKSSYAPGETIKISYSAADAASYNISVWRGAYGTGTKVTSSSGLSSSGATWKTSTPGTYTVYLEAVNSYGTVSATCQFTVTGGKPSNVKVSTDKSSYTLDEKVTISYSADDANSYNYSLWLGAYGTGTLIHSETGMKGGRITWTLARTGTYTVYLEAVNGYGTVSATCQFTLTNGMPFTDVSANAYYADAVKWAIDKNITTGTSTTTFSPNATVRRSDAVTFLWRAMGRPTPSGSKNDFNDVKASAYYFQAVQWAVEKGITTGMTTTEFDPDGTVTRGQLITFLWRAMGKPGATGQGTWYADAEYWARSNDLLRGTTIAYGTDLSCPRSDVVYYMWNALT